MELDEYDDVLPKTMYKACNTLLRSSYKVEAGSGPGLILSVYFVILYLLLAPEEGQKGKSRPCCTLLWGRHNLVLRTQEAGLRQSSSCNDSLRSLKRSQERVRSVTLAHIHTSLPSMGHFKGERSEARFHLTKYQLHPNTKCR